MVAATSREERTSLGEWETLGPKPAAKPQPLVPNFETIRSDGSFRRLFTGFSKARLITFVGEPKLILDLLDKDGFTSVDLIISENFNEIKGRLKQQGQETLRALTERMDSGALRVYVPKPHSRIHTKLYILENPKQTRVILTSRNLSMTRSLDFALWFDLSPDHPFVAEANARFDEHLTVTVPFLDDLRNRLRQEPEAEAQIIKAYLADPDAETEAQPVYLARATQEALANPDIEVLSIQIPDNPRERKRLEEAIEKAGFTVDEGESVYRVDSHRFRSVISRIVQLPIMTVYQDRRRVAEIIDGDVLERASPPPADREEVSRWLDHIERYISGVDVEQASAREKLVHKTAMMEVLLYLFASPFSHELMRLMQHHFGLVQKRGPRFLLVQGPTHRGKTTFLAFALALIAGRRVEPLSAKTYFKEGFIRQALTYKTTFPLIFDDMLSVTSTQFEGIVKDYWEKNWNSRDPVPQLVFSTNRGSIRQSVTTRVKRVYFPVYIEPTPEKKKRLNLLREDEPKNHLFEWFAYTYLELLDNQEQPPPDDDLFLARSAMKKLYTFAGRPVPDYFPEEPFEKLYDTSREEWADMINELHKAQVTDSGDRILVQFGKDMSREDVQPYSAMLPLNMDHEVKGNTIIIRSAQQFRDWLPLAKQAPAEPLAPPPPPPPARPLQPTEGIGERIKRIFKRGSP
ncbi:MAG: phospholipase D family protein [Thermoplasmata archaeon]